MCSSLQRPQGKLCSCKQEKFAYKTRRQTHYAGCAFFFTAEARCENCDVWVFGLHRLPTQVPHSTLLLPFMDPVLPPFSCRCSFAAMVRAVCCSQYTIRHVALHGLPRPVRIMSLPSRTRAVCVAQTSALCDAPSIFTVLDVSASKLHGPSCNRPWRPIGL
jgi:hypothetical protein